MPLRVVPRQCFLARVAGCRRRLSSQSVSLCTQSPTFLTDSYPFYPQLRIVCFSKFSFTSCHYDHHEWWLPSPYFEAPSCRPYLHGYPCWKTLPSRCQLFSLNSEQNWHLSQAFRCLLPSTLSWCPYSCLFPLVVCVFSIYKMTALI